MDLQKIILLAFLLIGVKVYGQNDYLLIGKYDSDTEKGIAVCRWDPVKKDVDHMYTFDEVSNPSYLLYDSINSMLYTVEEIASPTGGWLTALYFDKANGKLKKINSVPSMGDHPCVLTMSPDRRYILIGNYTGGNFSVFRIREDGAIGQRVQTIAHEGSSANTQRQEAPHVHDLVFSPDHKYLLVADLGTDRVEVYQYNENAEQPFVIKKNKGISVPAGHGPRHVKFTPEGDKLIIVEELSETIGVANFKNGKLKYVKTEKLTSDNENNKGSAAEIQFLPGESSFIVSNRGEINMLTYFDLDNEEELSFSAGVKVPRYFMILPGGKELLVAGQESNEIILLEKPFKSTDKLEKRTLLKTDKPVFILPVLN
ncbi:lactonase family protein [Mangrovivirga sp. M17]|uniref:Lactonase family protein n=1 Tax=Mangrovivirga halotolerans TaxID=2993936 RepID=A0ABT3RMB5_9BACT|nr:lactonase family protein [Mangrovivirga halotolerans]MCX2742711.1 lactonase family protein [Mangrovivirga halotolerans]